MRSYIDASRWTVNIKKRPTVHAVGLCIIIFNKYNGFILRITFLILFRVTNKIPPNTDNIPKAILFDCSLPALGSSLALLFAFVVPVFVSVCFD